LKKVLPKRYDLLIVSISSPLLLGVYEEGRLIETFSSELQTSQILLPLIQKVLKKYPISRMIYTRGPGSYMAIKLTYLTLKTLEIMKGIPCVGCSGFALNGGEPIKAVGNLYFIKQKETIITEKFEQSIHANFALPECIDDLVLDEVSTPDYVLPAI
jgi:tRNA A37 threonylcarbamoyladenosine modification protein TsaB